MINQILIGDVLEKLKEIPDQFVNTVVTSPPYWGLRDYGNEPQMWGGDKDCKHEWGEERIQPKDSGRNRGEWTTGGNPGKKIIGGPVSQGSFCQKCGTWLGSLGLEPTPDLYVEHIVIIFREVRRVLRDDGTVWLNLGDSYADSRNQGGTKSIQGSSSRIAAMTTKGHKIPLGLKPKDLVGIPWMVAFALRTDGWYLRQDIIWHKSNPMPESVTDRCTKAHEYIFLLSKSRQYYYDADSIKEPACDSTIDRNKYARAGNLRDLLKKEIDPLCLIHPPDNKESNKRVEKSGRNKRSVWQLQPHLSLVRTSQLSPRI